MSVTRYTCKEVYAGNGNMTADMETAEDGEYVDWDDYKTLRQDLRELCQRVRNCGDSGEIDGMAYNLEVKYGWRER